MAGTAEKKKKEKKSYSTFQNEIRSGCSLDPASCWHNGSASVGFPYPLPIPTRLGGKELIAQRRPFAASSVRMTPILCMCLGFRTDRSCRLMPDSARSQVLLPLAHALIPVPTHPSIYQCLSHIRQRARQHAERLNYRREWEADPEPGCVCGRGRGWAGGLQIWED